MNIVQLSPDDRAEWESLWQDSVDGVMTDQVIEDTYQKILQGDVHAFVAKTNGKITGLLHFVIHPVAGCMHDVCYMQDLYVTPKMRRQGIAEALVNALEDYAEKHDLDRVYWLLDQKNETAKEFYKDLGVSLDFNLYMIPIRMRERLNLPKLEKKKA
jgi:ribosomal protein S18 acetylase RimI-like enzyme